MDFRKHFSDQLIKSIQGDTKAILEIDVNNQSKKITIFPSSIDEMKNIEVKVSSTTYESDYHPAKFICKIYGNDKLISTTDHIPNIQLTMYIEKKIVLDFEECPKVVILKYDAIVLNSVEKFVIESKIEYNNGPIYVSDLQIYNVDGPTKKNPTNDIKMYRACCELSRAAHRGIYDSNSFIQFVDTCNFCDIDIKPNYQPIWYVNTPKNDFFLCDDCGETIGEKIGDNDILRCYKFQKWKC